MGLCSTRSGWSACRTPHRRAPARPWRWPDLPLQFELELDAVVTELQLDLDLNLVRDADAHACTALDELELVVPGEVIGERVQASRDLLAREPITAARDISAAEAAP